MRDGWTGVFHAINDLEKLAIAGEVGCHWGSTKPSGLGGMEAPLEDWSTWGRVGGWTGGAGGGGGGLSRGWL